MLIDGVNIFASGFRPGRDELAAYVKYTKLKYGDNITHIVVELTDNGEVDVRYTAHYMPFERIRRITGRPD